MNRSVRKSQKTLVQLYLYIAGQTPKSLTAFVNLKRICNQYLEGTYELRVIDVLQTPYVARADDIEVVPTLVRRDSLPPRKIVGDLSDLERVLPLLTLEFDLNLRGSVANFRSRPLHENKRQNRAEIVPRRAVSQNVRAPRPLFDHSLSISD
jgi:circadian clock protein KaiB